MYSNSLPLLKNSTYLNTAYVGPMTNTLAKFRREHDEKFVHNGGDYKLKAYETLNETHEVIASFFGASSNRSFIVSNFSFGIRQALTFLSKNMKVLILEDDYPSLCDAFLEQGFHLSSVSQKVNVEQVIKSKIKSDQIEVLALSIVQYTSGMLIDIDFLKELKKEFPKLLIVGDGTQFLGAHPFHFSTSPFDIVSGSGYKWLMAGFGNGILLTSEHYYKTTGITPEILYNRVFNGHFNILATASLRFAIEELKKNDFLSLMEQKEELAQIAKLRLTELNYIESWVSERKSHSSIFSLSGGVELHNLLIKNNIKCAIRGNRVRVSFHHFNQMGELETLLKVLNSIPVIK